MAITETIPFNFDETYSFIENKFIEKGYDVQEGSNTMQLVSAMSYLTSMLNLNTAVNINETLLTLARKRDMVLQDARVMGYEVAHRQSYQYDITLRFDEIGNYNIVKYTSFTSGDKTYYYLGETIDDVNQIVVTDTFVEAEYDVNNVLVTPESGGAYKTIRVVEGTRTTYDDEPDVLVDVIEQSYNVDIGEPETPYYIDIPFINVEETYGIEVFLTYYDEFGTLFENEKWTKSTQFMIDSDTILNQEFVRLDNIEYKTPRIYFKLGDVGKEIRLGSITKINVLQSAGIEGAITDQLVSNGLPAIVVDTSLILQGAEEESIASIKQNAPLFHNSANRAVTSPDYIAFINRQAAIRYSDVWDGNREWPHVPGHIWFSFVPSTLTRDITDLANPGYSWELDNTIDDTFANYYVEDTEIATVFENLDSYKIPTLRFHHRHPIYVDFKYDISIARYAVVTSKSDINTSVFGIINDYFQAAERNDSDIISAEQFGFEYFQSNLIKRMDQSLTDIMGFDVALETSIRLFNKHIINEDINDNENLSFLNFHLGLPFEGLFNENKEVIIENLPDISTDNIIGTQRLYVDISNEQIDLINRLSTFDIKLTDNTGVEDLVNDTTIGSYRVFNNVYQDIEITLFVIDSDGSNTDINITSDYTEGLRPEDLAITGSSSGINISIKYPTPNIPFARNTIPRLHTVNFK